MLKPSAEQSTGLFTVGDKGSLRIGCALAGGVLMDQGVLFQNGRRTLRRRESNREGRVKG